MDKENSAQKSTYIVESHVTHDRGYDQGDEIELTDAEAKQLLESGAVSEPKNASRDAREAPKQRAEAENVRNQTAAREAHDAAIAAHETATAEVVAAQAKLDEAKRRVTRSKENVTRVGATISEKAHTWEADADRLGGDQLMGSTAGSAQGKPAEAPAHGGEMTPSSPTREAVNKSKSK